MLLLVTYSSRWTDSACPTADRLPVICWWSDWTSGPNVSCQPSEWATSSQRPGIGWQGLSCLRYYYILSIRAATSVRQWNPVTCTTEVAGKLGASVLAAVRTRTAPGTPIFKHWTNINIGVVSVFDAYDFEHLYDID